MLARNSILLAANLLLAVSIAYLFSMTSAMSAPAVSASTASSSKITKLTSAQLTALSNVMEKRDLSKDEFERLAAYVQDNPSDPRGHAMLARAYELSGLEDLALEQLVSAWNADKKDLSVLLSAQLMALKNNNKTVYQSLNASALSYFERDYRSLNTLAAISEKRGESDDARRFLKAALQAAPNDVDTRLLYLSSLLANHEYAEVLKQIRTMDNANENPQIANMIATLQGISLLRLNYPHQAAGFLEKAFKSSPANLNLCKAYFEALTATGKYKSAVFPGMMMLALQPPFGDALAKTKRKLLPVFRKMHISSEQLQRYVDDVGIHLNDAGRFAYFNFALADLMDELGNFSDAELLFSKGLNLDGSFGRGYMRLARVMEKLGRDPELVNDLYKSAVEADPKDAEIIASYRRSIARNPARKTDLAARTKTFIRSRR